MRSVDMSLDKYNSDKISNRYLEQYDPFLKPFVDKDMALLELGILKGGSLLLWHDYFPRATIVGIDITIQEDLPSSTRIRTFEGSQADPEFLTRVANDAAPAG